MSILDALILGIVEGITEFLPVSSTGHLIVAQRMLGVGASEAANAFAIVIQLGAILAVLRLYGDKVAKVFDGLTKADAEGRRLLQCLIVAFIPAAVAGLALDDMIDAHLFKPGPVVFAWLLGGFILLWWDKTHGRKGGGQPLEALHWRAALGIGLFQCLALWPGTSRSFVTIMGGVAVGLSLQAAVDFSFLLGVLTLGAASAYSGHKHFSSLGSLGGGLLLIGMLASAVSAYLAVRWMVDWIKGHGLAIFGYWRILAGLLVGYLVATGWLTIAPPPAH
jgi:undecaprenyl-diphosphatase